MARSPARRIWLTATLLALSCVLLAVSAVNASAAQRAFGTPRFQTNDTGAIVYAGNTLSTCADGSSAVVNGATLGCEDGRAGRNALYNNLVPNQLVNVAGIGTGATANSSSATFTLPQGAQVTWAGLYWGGDPGQATTNPAQTIQLRTPGTGAFRTVTAQQFDSGAPVNHPNAYQGFADVTDLVRQAGGGVYTAGGIPIFAPSDPAANPNDSYGGWSLVIVTKDPAQPSRNLSVFDGFQAVNQTTQPTINVTGFLTPPTGAVNTELGIIAYEGDRGITGDFAQLNGQNLSDNANPATNFFNSTLTTLGQRRAGSTPDYDNQFGYDADIFDATGYIPNGATSASIKLGSTGDVYAPGVVTLATELYAPKFTATKTVENRSRATGATQRGDLLRYTVSYENTGGDAAAGVRIDDAIPTGTTYEPGSLRITSPGATQTPTDAAGDDTGEYDAANRVVRFRPGTGASATSGGTIAVGQTATVTFDVRANQNLADNTRIDNVATASYRAATSGAGFTDIPSPAATTVVRAPDLQIAKTVTSGPITAGQNVQFALSVTNAGGAPTSGTVTVTDTVDAAAFPTIRGASGQGWTCTVNGRTVTCTRTDALAGGAGYPPILLDVTAANNLPATVQNSTTVAGGGDSNTTNNTGTATGPGTNRADLNVTKRFAQSNAIVGGTVSWTIEVRNDGPSDATGATVSDTVPAGLTVTNIRTSRGTCSAVGTSPITCALGTIPSGENAVVTVTATVAGDPRVVTNTATAQSNVTDPNTANNTSSSTLTVDPSADLSITKTGPATAPNAGATPYSFTLNVRNDGPNAAQNVNVTDAIPANFNVTGVTATGGLTCTTNAQRVLCTTASFANGATATVTISGTSPAGGLVTNNATIDSTTTDPDTTDNAATAAVQVGTLADLSLVKSFDPAGPVAAGANATVRLDVTNGGPSSATNVTTTDVLPASLQFVSSANGCTAAGQTVTCPLGTVASGATVRATFVVQVQTGTGTAVNTASVRSPDVADPFPGNNSSTARLPLTASADMTVTNTASVATANVGDQITWTVRGVNNGPSAAVNPRFTVQIPDGVNAAAIQTTTANANCTLDAAARTITCTGPASLASGDSFGLTFTGTVAEQAGGSTLIDPANVTSDTGDPDGGNNSAQASVRVNPAYRLTVDKTARDTTVAPDQATTFDITVRNAGPSDATNVTLTDTLPASTVFVAADAGCAVNGGVVTCDIASIPAGTTATRTITVRTTRANGGTTITNSARYATNDPETTDLNKNQPANSDSASVAVSTIADLQVTNTPNVTNAVVGDPVSWTVVGRNNGPNPAVNATFTVDLPANVDNLTITANNANCTRTGQTLTCAPGTLAPGDAVSVTFGGTVARAAAGTTLNDPAVITSDTADPSPDNNRANGPIAIGRRYELSVDKTAVDPAVNPGAIARFDLSVTNAGPNDATGVSLVDRLPTGTTYESGPADCTPNPVNNTVTCAVGNVAAGATVTRRITIRTSAANAGQTITNALTYTTNDPASVDVNKNSPTLANDTATVAVAADADLGVTNTATVLNPRADGSAEPGGTVRFQIVGTNNGPSSATNAVLTVNLPAGIDPASVVLDPAASQGCVRNGSTITCTRATLPNGATIPLTFTANVTTASAGTTVTVPATIDSDTGDLTPANDSASSSVRVGRRYALTLDKVAVAGTVQPGDIASFDLNITNDGPSEATGINLVDTLPTGTTFDSGDATCTPNGAGTQVTCAVASVPAGQTVTRRINVRTGNTPGTTITNSATYTSGDPEAIDVNKNNTGRNTDTAQVNIAPRADLAVTITPNPNAANVGDSVTWTIVGTNNGPNTASDVSFQVTLPAGVNYTGSTGTGCAVDPANNRLLTCTRDTLASGGTFTGTITGTIDRSAAGTTVSVPAVITSATTTDPNLNNNNASAAVAIGRRYEIKVEKTAAQTRVGPGQDIAYTLRITNDGPNDATGVNLVDPLPANTTLVSATQGCTVAGTTVTCPIGTLANGASETREITVRPTNAAAGTTVTNSATYTTPDGPTVDVNRNAPAGTGTAAVQVTPLVDLGITKSVTPGRVTAGGEVIYTLDVVNNGPNAATGVVVADDLPAGLTVLQTTPTQGACGVNGRAVRCDLGTVAAGGRAQVIIRARADAAGTAVNKATITSDQAESNPTDNTSGEVPLVIDPAPTPAPDPTPGPAPAPADLVLNKELISQTVTVGRVLTYRITVTNRGGSVARGVRVTDVPSRTLDVLGVRTTAGSCPGRSPITCNLGDLAPGQTAQVTVQVRANAPGKLSNAATAVATNSPEVPAETDVADTSVRRLASSVSVKKTASARSVRGGSSVRFTIRVKNFTRKTVRKVLVCDTLPRGLVFQKASPLKVTGRKACGTIATLKAGQVRTFVLTVRAESRKTAKTLTNAARAVVPNELSSKASRAIRVLPGPGATGNGGVTG